MSNYSNEARKLSEESGSRSSVTLTYDVLFSVLALKQLRKLD